MTSNSPWFTLVLLGAFGACTSEPEVPPASSPPPDPTPLRPSYDEWLAAQPRTPLGRYLIEGDIATRDGDTLRALYDHEYPAPNALVVNTDWRGRWKTWNSSSKHNITYCVSDAFGATAPQVKDLVQRAAAGWESAADVNFVFIDAGANCNRYNQNVVFDIRPGEGGECTPGLLGESFTPGEAREDREVFLCPDGALDMPTIRHELGHALGFAHEFSVSELQAGGTDGCDSSNASTFYQVISGYPVSGSTPYGGADPYSVMTYQGCIARPDPEYFTAYDMQGAAAVYGRAANYDLVPADYDGDGIADFAVRAGMGGNWFIDFSKTPELEGVGTWDFVGVAYGTTGSHPVPADYNNFTNHGLRDGKADIAVKNDFDGSWCIDYANDGFTGWNDCYYGYGGSEAKAVPGDYDGDGKADLSVKTDDGHWNIDFSSYPAADGRPFGQWNMIVSGYGFSNVTPVPADYDGDGRTDLAINDNNGTWYIDYSNDGPGCAAPNPPCFNGWNVIATHAYGGLNATYVPADYDGDGKADIAWKDNASGSWFIDYAYNGFNGAEVGHGSYGDAKWKPIPAKWHPGTDKKADVAAARLWDTTVDMHWYVDTSPYDGAWNTTTLIKQ